MKRTIALFTVLGMVLFSQAAYAERGHGSDGERKGSRQEKMENFVKSLGVTPEQQEQLKEHREQSREESKVIRDILQEKQGALRQVLQDPNFDEAQARQISVEVEQLKGELSDLRIDGAAYMRSVLTPEQYAQFAEKMKKAHQKRKGSRNTKGEKSSKRGPQEHQSEYDE